MLVLAKYDKKILHIYWFSHSPRVEPIRQIFSIFLEFANLLIASKYSGYEDVYEVIDLL